MGAQEIKHKLSQADDKDAKANQTKKSRYAYLYEPIARSKLPQGTPAREGNRFLAKPATIDVIGVSFSAGQVIL